MIESKSDCSSVVCCGGGAWHGMGMAEARSIRAWRAAVVSCGLCVRRVAAGRGVGAWVRGCVGAWVRGCVRACAAACDGGARAQVTGNVEQRAKQEDHREQKVERHHQRLARRLCVQQ